MRRIGLGDVGLAARQHLGVRGPHRLRRTNQRVERVFAKQALPKLAAQIEQERATGKSWKRPSMFERYQRERNAFVCAVRIACAARISASYAGRRCQ